MAMGPDQKSNGNVPSVAATLREVAEHPLVGDLASADPEIARVRSEILQKANTWVGIEQQLLRHCGTLDTAEYERNIMSMLGVGPETEELGRTSARESRSKFGPP